MFCVKSRIARLFTCIVHTEFRDREGVYVVAGSFSCSSCAEEPRIIFVDVTKRTLESFLFKTSLVNELRGISRAATIGGVRGDGAG